MPWPMTAIFISGPAHTRSHDGVQVTEKAASQPVAVMPPRGTDANRVGTGEPPASLLSVRSNPAVISGGTAPRHQRHGAVTEITQSPCHAVPGPSGPVQHRNHSRSGYREERHAPLWRTSLRIGA